VITERLKTADGVSVGLHHFTADDSSPRPAVLLLHGAFTSHRVWLRGFAAYFAERGFDVWLADLRHHGVSDREPAPRTWWFEDWITRDAPALLARIRERTGARPLGVVGHSAGGVVALGVLARAVAHPPFEALVALGSPGPRDLGVVRRGGAVAARAMAQLLGRFPARALRFGGEDEGAHLFSQWMGWNIRGRWQGRDGLDYLEALTLARTPYLGVAGGRDWFFSPPYACREIVERIGSPRKDFHIATALDHPGLVLDPWATEQVTPRAAEWLRAVLA